VGVGGATGRLVELGERKRRAQFIAARALLLRDGDRGSIGFFGVRWIVVEKGPQSIELDLPRPNGAPAEQSLPNFSPTEGKTNRD
jgi:hypothetical protein